MNVERSIFLRLEELKTGFISKRSFEHFVKKKIGDFDYSDFDLLIHKVKHTTSRKKIRKIIHNFLNKAQ